jgi:hypothetical protein
MDAKEIQEALASPFDPSEVKFKPQLVKNNRALAAAYIDARLVQDRLDDVVGVGGWKTEFTQVSPESVECRLSLRIDGEWITRADVGSTSEQPDAGDRMKAAYSDALKRAAVQFGVGRYLYRLPATWADYDPVKKMFTQLPRLPESARPAAVVHQAKVAQLAVAAPQRAQLAPAGNRELRAEAIEAYEHCTDYEGWKEVTALIAADASAGKFSDADKEAIREAAAAARERLAGAAA